MSLRIISKCLVKKPLLLFLSPLMAWILGYSSAAQNPPKQPPGGGNVGFSEKNESSFLSLIPPYPILQSLGDEADVAGVRQWQQSGNSLRWQLAQADAEISYNRFAEAFGSTISPASTPLLVHLLDRVEADLSAVLANAKRSYNRPRPYQRLQMARVCGFNPAPAAEVDPKGGNSYPSGHATFGWSMALLLAEVAPERAQIILARGREYGESRIVCAVHYPSDVLAGELLVSALVGRLYAVPEFKRELICAQQEHLVALRVRPQLGLECLSPESELQQKAPVALEP